MNSEPSMCCRINCQQESASNCKYIDRLMTGCALQFCQQHHMIINNISYCPRHGNLVSAILAGDMAPSPLPSVDNRAPSLVNYITTQIAPKLESIFLNHTKVKVVKNPVTLTFFGVNRKRSWTAKWSLPFQFGEIAILTISVFEDDSKCVHIRLDSAEIAQGIPPWISDRNLSPSDTLRQDFCNFLVRQVEEKITELSEPNNTIYDGYKKVPSTWEQL